MKNTLAKLAIAAVVGLPLAYITSAETIITNEFWICDTTNTSNLGTLNNPFDGSDQSKFDMVMSNMPPNCAIHILAGTYQTWGIINWGAKTGQKISGSGIDVTVLQLAADTPGASLATTNGVTIVADNEPPQTNIEVSDLTCDCNYGGQSGGNYTCAGVQLDGAENKVRRVRVKNTGYVPGYDSEVFAISLANNYLPFSAGNIIEECEVDPLVSGHNISGIVLNAGENTFITGIIRNNRVFLCADPEGAQIAYNSAWGTDCQFEDNYADGADSGFVTDTGGSTNMIFAHNIFKDVYAGFVFWNYHRQNLTFAFNKISLCPTNTYFSTAFGFPDGTTHTNILIIGNDVGWDGIPSRSAYFLCVSNIAGLTVADNTVDSSLYNFIGASGLNMFNNYDLYGNYLPDLNIPAVGGTPVTSLGLALISSAEVASALTNLGLPGNPAVVVTNNEAGVTLSGTFSGNGSGLTGLNASQLTGGAVPLAQLPSAVVTNDEEGSLTFDNMYLGGMLSISNSVSPEPQFDLNFYTATDSITPIYSAAYIDLDEQFRRLYIGSPAKPITRLNMQNVAIGENFPSMLINTQAFYTTPINRSWAFVASGQGQGYLALIANSALGYITGQQSTDYYAGHRSLAFMTFSDTNDVWHHTAQYVFDTYEPSFSWFTNQVYWSWRIGGSQIADIDTNASWHLMAPTFSVSGSVAGTTVTATNGFQCSTNYNPSTWGPVAGSVILRASNNWMFAITTMATNAAFKIGR